MNRNASQRVKLVSKLLNVFFPGKKDFFFLGDMISCILFNGKVFHLLGGFTCNYSTIFSKLCKSIVVFDYTLSVRFMQMSMCVCARFVNPNTFVTSSSTSIQTAAAAAAASVAGFCGRFGWEV